MKKIKNKIAVLVCGLVLLFGINTIAMAQRCVTISYECCGGAFAGDYDLDGNLLAELLVDIYANCNC
ncbi:MAG: hypothetical protein LBP85_03610 [Prevotellaceae bacterium]|nr:hypothetical protein [Prevotellaceae bacterium]